MPPQFMKHFFQLGYVTPDLDQALAVYRDRFGVSQFLAFNSAEINPDAAHPIRVALAWTGEAMIELIQPLGHHPLYACAMPESGFAIRLHHTGYLLHDDAAWRKAQEWVAEQGLAIASRTKAGALFELIYVDARDVTGHHLEIINASPEGRAFFESIPRN